LAKVIRRHWAASFAPGIPRRERQPCEYEAYVPDRLVGRSFRIDGAVAADIVDAEAAINKLNQTAAALVDLEALARLLLRAESVASSKIEGLEVGARRLLRVEAAITLGERSSDVTAMEVLGNIDAMVFAIDQVAEGDAIRLEALLEMHRRLLASSRLHEHGGLVRAEQNWIGGSDYNPCSAAFVPPPPEMISNLFEDLIQFCNGDDLPALAQAALAHAQFETIHPFVDGNGRIGRALIHLVLRRRGLTPTVLPPISLILATWARDYVAGLSATRYRGSAHSAAAHDGINRWVALFATAARRSAQDASAFEARVARIAEQWRSRIPRIRASSAADLLLRVLPGAPIVTVKSAAGLITRTPQATNEAIARLLDAEVLRQVTVGRRNRAFEAPEIIQAFTDLERQLASPEGDTRSSSPARRVPHRRN
jgi:Fic family protein